MHTEELPPAIFHTDDHQAPASESDDDDFIIISEDEAETADPKTISNTSLDGWVFYRVSSAPATDASPGDDVSDSESDIFILAGDEEGLESVPGKSAFVCVNVVVALFHKASLVTEAERSDSERRSCKARGIHCLLAHDQCSCEGSHLLLPMQVFPNSTGFRFQVNTS